MSSRVSSSSEEKAVVQSPPPSTSAKAVGFWYNVFIGSLSGMAAVSFIQPMIYFKNVQQAPHDSKSRHVEKNPRVWYRGVSGFAASFAPTIALQTAAHGFFVSIMNPFLASSSAGIVSAFIVCPAEGVMNQQQMTGKSFWEAAKHLHSSSGFAGFYRGLFPTTIREGGFTAAYLSAAPGIKEKIQSLGVNEWVAQMVAGAAAGTTAAIVTHPFDTYKTRKQRDLSLRTSMASAIFQRTAFAGLGWRIAMVNTATTVMPFVQEKLKKS